METYIAYFDETGDDGVTTASSTHFVLTSIYMPASKWQENYNKVKALRKTLRDKYGFHVSEEMHTKHFLTDKNPYRTYGWSKEVKQEILKAFTLTLAEMELQIINVVIDKNHIVERRIVSGTGDELFSGDYCYKTTHFWRNDMKHTA